MKFPTSRSLLALLALAGILAGWNSTVSGTTILDTTPGNSLIGEFGERSTATYGQTITVPLADTVLTSFTFYVNDLLNTDVVDFDAYVYPWGTTKATGPAVFSSGPYTTNNNGGAGGFQAFTINTGSLQLTGGAKYVLAFSTSNQFDGEVGTSNFSIRDNNPYSGGGFVNINNDNDLGLLTANNWDTSLINFYDLTFTATFVPEPASAILSLFTLITFLLVGRRRLFAPPSS